MTRYGTDQGHFTRWIPALNVSASVEVPSYGVVGGTWRDTISNDLAELGVFAATGAATPQAAKVFVNSPTPIPASNRGTVSNDWPLRARSQVRTAGEIVQYIRGTFELGQVAGIYENWFPEFYVLADYGDGISALVIPRGFLSENV